MWLYLKNDECGCAKPSAAAETGDMRERRTNVEEPITADEKATSLCAAYRDNSKPVSFGLRKGRSNSVIH